MKCKLPKRIVPISLKFYPFSTQSTPNKVFFKYSFIFPSPFFCPPIIIFLFYLYLFLHMFSSLSSSLLLNLLPFCFFLVFLLSFSFQRLRQTKPLYSPSQTVFGRSPSSILNYKGLQSASPVQIRSSIKVDDEHELYDSKIGRSEEGCISFNPYRFCRIFQQFNNKKLGKLTQ